MALIRTGGGASASSLTFTDITVSGAAASKTISDAEIGKYYLCSGAFGINTNISNVTVTGATIEHVKDAGTNFNADGQNYRIGCMIIKATASTITFGGMANGNYFVAVEMA